MAQTSIAGSPWIIHSAKQRPTPPPWQKPAITPPGLNTQRRNCDRGTYNQVVGYASLRSGLTEIDASGSAIADLAEGFESSPDAKTWIFRLRKGAEFHNGKSVTTDDVIASFNHHRGDDSTSAAKSLLASVPERPLQVAWVRCSGSGGRGLSDRTAI